MATINPSNQQITNHAIQVGAANNLLTSLAVGSTGTVLQGNTGADPSFSTATYPSTATGTGTLLRADGTNWVATTSTYPNTNAINTLLYASSANVMSALATVNSNVLTTSSGGVPTWASQSSVGTWVFLSSQTAANVASINFTTGISSTYNTYKVVMSKVNSTKNTAVLFVKISIDGGSTYIATNYVSGLNSIASDDTTWTNVNSTVRANICDSWDGSANTIYAGTIYLSDMSSGSRTQFYGSGNLHYNTDGKDYYEVIHGSNSNTSQVNAIQFAMSTGNIITGKFSLYGLVES